MRVCVCAVRFSLFIEGEGKKRHVTVISDNLIHYVIPAIKAKRIHLIFTPIPSHLTPLLSSLFFPLLTPCNLTSPLTSLFTSPPLIIFRDEHTPNTSHKSIHQSISHSLTNSLTDTISLKLSVCFSPLLSSLTLYSSFAHSHMVSLFLFLFPKQLNKFEFHKSYYNVMFTHICRIKTNKILYYFSEQQIDVI